MARKPTREELEQRIGELEEESAKRKRAEEKVKNSVSLLEATLESTADGILVVDGMGKMVRFNGKFAEMWNLPEEISASGDDEAVLNFVLSQLREPDQFLNKVRELYSSPETSSFDVLEFRDGRVFERYSQPQKIVDSVIGRVWSFRDVTERKLAEETLRKISEKTKLFAYSVSHDLKSPTVAIYGLAKRLQQIYADVLDERGKTYCDQILKAAELLSALVAQINVYISTSTTTLVIERVKLKDIMHMVIEEFSGQLGVRQIKWSEPEHLPEVNADRIAILRVFRNLVDNALKYGGEALSEIDIGYTESDESHIICIKDNGIGLKEQNPHQDIFAPFIRTKTSKGIQGSGLGLYIVREIAEKHGGQVWLEPGQERGMAFYMLIPKNLQLSP